MLVKTRLLPWLTVALAAIGLAAVASGSAKTTTAGAVKASAAPTKAGGGNVRVAIVTDIGGLNDRSFNTLANRGRLRADRLAGVDTRVYITNRPAERLPNLIAAARAGHDLIIGVGFLMFDVLDDAARAFPNTEFAGVDVPWELIPGRPQNVRGLLFKEQEAGYLAGYIAGLTIQRRPVGGQQIVAAVGANNVPPIVRFIAGYRAGARAANRRVRVFYNYANDPTFNDQAKCKETALSQIANGAGVIFQVAGGCGLGALDAARQRRVWGIGVDADQSFLGPHILTSAVKKVDVAVFKTIQAYRANPNRFKTGYNVIFDVKSGAVGYGRVSPRAPGRASLIRAAERIRARIAAGRIRIPQAL